MSIFEILTIVLCVAVPLGWMIAFMVWDPIKTVHCPVHTNSEHKHTIKLPNPKYDEYYRSHLVSFGIGPQRPDPHVEVSIEDAIQAVLKHLNVKLEYVPSTTTPAKVIVKETI